MDIELAEQAIKVLSSKGVLSVLEELACGTRRHNELARAVKVDHKTLDKTLRRLQDADLVVREVHPVPLRVHYRLTAHASGVLHAVAGLATEWRTCTRSEARDRRYPGSTLRPTRTAS
ncbi:winged helix-turn-helix transcriptional regulator [Actinophytocola oryzae]|uniref:HxlR family transcriptional regulator n=1 Tax=Actinophytocola oryzae TaxID=502181 RepID=A0A4R7VKE8_9PSEU|nr:helix-turn-helix domain-containing protein [Actinophytocola oryzae]TDV49944.1 HxlR family transcriptional regulator [Actinophytocola oryzae]